MTRTRSWSSARTSTRSCEGPGINDNGSGTRDDPGDRRPDGEAQASKPQQQGALRVLGRRGVRAARLRALRRHPAATRSSAKIYANLNFDMLGLAELCPVRLRRRRLGYRPAPARPGSAQIEQIFTDYFASQGLASEPTAFDGRSDYGPFIAVGIPAGGLFSGAEGIKTPEEAAIFGGTAGAAVRLLLPPGLRHPSNNLSTTALPNSATRPPTRSDARPRPRPASSRTAAGWPIGRPGIQQGPGRLLGWSADPLIHPGFTAATRSRGLTRATGSLLLCV